ncbi:MAG: hypothetical protein ABSG17_20325 [Spirochaetia bacterium]
MKLSLRLPLLDGALQRLRALVGRGAPASDAPVQSPAGAQEAEAREARLASAPPRRTPPRPEVLIVAAAGVVAFVITLIILSVSFNSRARGVDGQALKARGAQGAQGSAAASQAESDLSVDEFLLPVVRQDGGAPDYYPFRPRLEKWSRESVEKFWVSPRTIAADALGRINDRNMEDMFEKVK